MTQWQVRNFWQFVLQHDYKTYIHKVNRQVNERTMAENLLNTSHVCSEPNSERRASLKEQSNYGANEGPNYFRSPVREKIHLYVKRFWKRLTFKIDLKHFLLNWQYLQFISIYIYIYIYIISQTKDSSRGFPELAH